MRYAFLRVLRSPRASAVWVGALALAACGSPPPSADSADSAGETGEPPLEPLFSFAVFADPHLTDNEEKEDRLAAAVTWVNEQAEARGVALVFVVGDIGWGGGLERAEEVLGELVVPYAPVIGDNEIHFGDEENFDVVFGEQYGRLAETFPDWRRGAVEVWDPNRGETVWLQNFSFSFEGLRFVGLDWCSRDDDPLASEMAELHDFEDGTLPFFEEELTTLPAGPEENVLLFSHHPMMLLPGGFMEPYWSELAGLASPQGARIAGAYAGHLHVDYEDAVEEADYEVFITDAIWDDDVTVRLVSVYGNGLRYAFAQELVLVQ